MVARKWWAWSPRTRAVGSRRAAWCIISSVEQEDKTQENEQLAIQEREHVTKVEAELLKIYDGILSAHDGEACSRRERAEDLVLRS